MVSPELRKRFVDSIEYLRKIDFFKDYSNLTSEEIFNKILSGEIDYGTQWFVEEYTEEEWRREREEGSTHGQRLKESLVEHEEYWMKASDSKIDQDMAFFDVKRVFIEDPEAVIEKGMCIMLMKKLARISRGFFNPTDIREEILEWKGSPPPALKEALGESCSRMGCFFKVYFNFKGKEYSVEFYSDVDYLFPEPAVRKINEIIQDTGYQYYVIHDTDDIVYAVFSKNEVKELTERGWTLSLP
ncbi:MAG: hypothetical protein FGF48_06815 [Candidatus Brockarchaeota archaeon]|nr:hypothetical protein [Candidatus Brockarchaeota archaeon]